MSSELQNAVFGVVRSAVHQHDVCTPLRIEHAATMAHHTDKDWYREVVVPYILSNLGAVLEIRSMAPHHVCETEQHLLPLVGHVRFSPMYANERSKYGPNIRASSEELANVRRITLEPINGWSQPNFNVDWLKQSPIELINCRYNKDTPLTNYAVTQFLDWFPALTGLHSTDLTYVESELLDRFQYVFSWKHVNYGPRLPYATWHGAYDLSDSPASRTAYLLSCPEIKGFSLRWTVVELQQQLSKVMNLVEESGRDITMFWYIRKGHKDRMADILRALITHVPEKHRPKIHLHVSGTSMVPREAPAGFRDGYVDSCDSAYRLLTPHVYSRRLT